jgi:hypothetical protein
MTNKQEKTQSVANRRAFMKKGLGVAAVGAAVLASGKRVLGQSNRLSSGDTAILRFLAAAELIESDLWTQYAELGGIGNNPPIEVDAGQTLNNYQIALSNLDSDGPQYITSNTLDEVSHATFLNAYLQSRGAEPVNFTQFETLNGSTATGSLSKLHLTNLMQLNVDTGSFKPTQKLHSRWALRRPKPAVPRYTATYGYRSRCRFSLSVVRFQRQFVLH